MSLKLIQKIMNDTLQELREALQSEIQHLDLNQLQKARHELSAKYREKRHTINTSHEQFMQTPIDRLSYLTTRMPATAAVIRRVLEEIRLRQPHIAIESILDIGAGPGTALWAFSAVFPIIKATLIEQDAELIQLGQRLLLKGSPSCFKNAVWTQDNILHFKTLPPHDCAIFSYVLNEVPAEYHAKLIETGWQASLKYVVLIEPGTPKGYQIILSARQQLISLGAFIIAPCPHTAECPLASLQSRWCHFSERLERSREHRLAKGGELGYEDEKYSYIIASKEQSLPYRARILNHPQKRSGHVNLELCTADGLLAKTISKRYGEAYKQAKKLDWGDDWPGVG
jgi:ribosomal protein RSM22 (predicted rRNA methylase)